MNNSQVSFLRSQFSKGFTLLELLIVISILGVLTAILLGAIDPVSQLQKSHDTQRKSDLLELQKALEQYYQDNNGTYPQSSSDFKILVGQSGLSWGSPWLPYLNRIPIDPKNPVRNYIYWSNGQSYRIYASLERGSADNSTCQSGGQYGVVCPNVPSGAACSSNPINVCNYGLTSPNILP